MFESAGVNRTSGPVTRSDRERLGTSSAVAGFSDYCQTGVMRRKPSTNRQRFPTLGSGAAESAYGRPSAGRLFEDKYLAPRTLLRDPKGG